MAGSDRTPPHAVDLLERLRQEPYQFHVFQALRRLETAYPDQPRVGESRRLLDDPIRLGLEPSMAFAPSTLAGFTPATDDRPPRLTQYFLGLLGPNGPLPLHLTEYARDRIRDFGDHTFARFLDLFHHRALSLFYRAWASAQPTVSFDRPEDDRFALYIGALFGLGLEAVRHRDAVPDVAKLHYAGRLVCQTRNAEGLQAILSDFFRLPVSVHPFIGRWLPLDEESRCRLGESPATGLLGQTMVIGERVWDCQHHFQLVFGPLGLVDYVRMLPGGESLKRLVAWVKNYLGDELAWDVKLVLKKDEVPPLRLDGTSRLGWTSWLTPGGLDHDADDLTLDALAYTG